MQAITQDKSPQDRTKPVLALDGVTKIFPGVRALSEVSLNLFPGQVMALVGEHGAGTSTVVKVLTGIYQPNKGDILLNGNPIHFSTPQSAANAGITAIHQETVLFDELSVAENIFLGHAPRSNFGLIDWPEMERRSIEILAGIGADIDPNVKLRELGIANKHLVAISRALSIDASVVIMDEPTAALSQKEIEELYSIIRNLKKQNKSIIFISHKLDEVLEICDEFTVLRDGEVINADLISNTNKEQLITNMAGREISQIFPKKQVSIEQEILNVKNLYKKTQFKNINFNLRKKEILGFYGLVGSGRTEVMKTIFGINKFDEGELTFKNSKLKIKSPKNAIQNGIVYLSEERQNLGMTGLMSVKDNIAGLSIGSKGIALYDVSDIQNLKAKGIFDVGYAYKTEFWNEHILICTRSGLKTAKINI